MESLKAKYYNSNRTGKREILCKIAAETKLSEQTVYHKIKGTRKFNFLEREKIAQIFDKSVEELFPMHENDTN